MSSSGATLNALDNIINTLKLHNVGFVLHEHEPVFTMEDFGSYLAFPSSHLVKVLALRTKADPTGFILTGIPGLARLGLSLVAEALKVSRSSLQYLPRAQFTSTTGCPIGALGLITPQRASTVLIDSSLRTIDPIYCGAGSNRHTLELHLAQLESIIPVRYACLTNGLS
ncbi:YbaK/EbsC family protein [Ferrimicrobium sp.]|jgi:prolyl-tRNA editing enzyme YbaK/EbsC (Cys-tRNA(Pro) deacylase)|uniref:YbaK/EbsC family protein n=1 Tax=Ferrimicrobium sp. TaxID=2926050 RepID=UPI0034DAE06E